MLGDPHLLGGADQGDLPRTTPAQLIKALKYIGLLTSRQGLWVGYWLGPCILMTRPLAKSTLTPRRPPMLCNTESRV